MQTLLSEKYLRRCVDTTHCHTESEFVNHSPLTSRVGWAGVCPILKRGFDASRSAAIVVASLEAGVGA